MAKRTGFGFGDDRPDDTMPAEGDAPAETTTSPAEGTPDPDRRDDAETGPIAPQRPGGETEPRKADETVSGGRYRVGDQLVDANGNPIKD